MNETLDVISRAAPAIVAGCGVLHLLMFVILWQWYRRHLVILTVTLDDFTRNLKHRSILDRGSHWSDQIEAFLADIRDVLDSSDRIEEQEALRQRLQVLDERRRYLYSLRFETVYNVCRSMIEAYPLAGVLGTILAIGLCLQAKGETTVDLIVQRFGEAIWATWAGLAFALVLMFINSLFEPAFIRLGENRQHIAETIARTKRAFSVG